MEIVHEKEFLHIHRLGNFDNDCVVGSSFFFKDTLNSFLDYYNKIEYSHPTVPGAKVDAIELIGHPLSVLKGQQPGNPYIKQKFNYDPVETLNYSRGIINDYTLFIREHIFEKVRRESFPDYPSRYKCIWVFPDEKTCLKYWHDKLIQNNRSFKVFRLKLTGKIHRASQLFLTVKTYNFKYWREVAFKYWTGINQGAIEEDELLFEGFAEVLEEINYEDYINATV